MSNYEYVVGLDAGITKDRCALCLVHPESDEVILDRLDCWAPQKGLRIQLERVEDWLEEVNQLFNVRLLVIDPYQLEYLCQRWEKRVRLERYSFQGGGHTKLGSNLKSLITNRKLRLYPNAGQLTLPNGTQEDLVTELAALIVVPQGNQGNFKVDHRPNQHNDRYCALSLACWGAVQLTKRFNVHDVLDNMLGTPKSVPDSSKIVPTVSDVHPVLPETKITKKKPIFQDSFIKVQDPMQVIHQQVKYIHCYSTFQAIPVINGDEVKLSDYPRQDEAAFAVNYTHELFNSPAPNQIPQDRLPNPEKQKEIRADVRSHLENLLLIKPQSKSHHQTQPQTHPVPSKK